MGRQRVSDVPSRSPEDQKADNFARQMDRYPESIDARRIVGVDAQGNFIYASRTTEVAEANTFFQVTGRWHRP